MVNYTGSIELGNVPHGFGIGMFLDENPSYTYTGEWRHGLATGFGKIQYANGDSYTGKLTFDYCRVLQNMCHQCICKKNPQGSGVSLEISTHR